MDSDLSGLNEIAQLGLLGDASEHTNVGAAVINDARRYLDANRAYCALTGYSHDELIDLHAGHNLVLEAMSQADFIHRITAGHGLGQAVIRHKDGTPLPVSYMLIPSLYTLISSPVSQLPCYISLPIAVTINPKIVNVHRPLTVRLAYKAHYCCGERYKISHRTFKAAAIPRA